MKKLFSLLLSAALSLCFSFACFAESAELSEPAAAAAEEPSYFAVMHDREGALSKEQDDLLYGNVYDAAKKTGYTVGVVYTTQTANGSAEQPLPDGFARDYYAEYCGSGDGILLFINKDSRYCWFMLMGSCSELIGEEGARILSGYIYDFLNKDDLYAAGYIFCTLVQDFYDKDYDLSGYSDTGSGYEGDFDPMTTKAPEPAPQPAADGKYTEKISGHYAVLHDLDDSLTESQELSVFAQISDVVKAREFSVCVLITDDVGAGKSDRQVTDFADVYYEKICGKDTDGILLLINNDTKFDWISTSGNCIKLFTDSRIDRIFDTFYDSLKDGDYFKAASGFVTSVDSYARKGVSYDDNYSSGKTTYYDEKDLFETVLSVAFPSLFFSAIVLIFFFSIAGAGFTPKARTGAKEYILPDSLDLTEKTDNFVRTYVTRHSASSSGGSHHHSGGHSSSHRSSGGGHHGGGGRHR